MEEEEEDEEDEEEEKEEKMLPAPLSMPLDVNGLQTRADLKTAREFCAGETPSRSAA